MWAGAAPLKPTLPRCAQSVSNVVWRSPSGTHNGPSWAEREQRVLGQPLGNPYWPLVGRAWAVWAEAAPREPTLAPHGQYQLGSPYKTYVGPLYTKRGQCGLGQPLRNPHWHLVGSAWTIRVGAAHTIPTLAPCGYSMGMWAWVAPPEPTLGPGGLRMGNMG